MNKLLVIDDNQGLTKKIAVLIGGACCPTHIDALKVKQMCAERSPLNRKSNKSDRKRNRANRW